MKTLAFISLLVSITSCSNAHVGKTRDAASDTRDASKDSVAIDVVEPWRQTDCCILKMEHKGDSCLNGPWTCHTHATTPGEATLGECIEGVLNITGVVFSGGDMAAACQASRDFAGQTCNGLPEGC